MRNIDDLAAFLRETMIACEKIRLTLKLGPANVNAEKLRVLADSMDMYIARPLADAPTTSSRDGGATEETKGGRSRFCYVKLVTPDSPIPECFHTYFWLANGNPLALDAVQNMRNFQVVPYVEVSDVFVNKAVRSIQLYLRECIVIPPPERLNVRYSVCFPGKVCGKEPVHQDIHHPELPDDQPVAKKPRVEEKPLPDESEEGGSPPHRQQSTGSDGNEEEDDEEPSSSPM